MLQVHSNTGLLCSSILKGGGGKEYHVTSLTNQAWLAGGQTDTLVSINSPAQVCPLPPFLALSAFLSHENMA